MFVNIEQLLFRELSKKWIDDYLIQYLTTDHVLNLVDC